MHNLCCDNCHSHVATALNIMKYKDRWDLIGHCLATLCSDWSIDYRESWNMVVLAVLMLVHGKYVSWGAVVKTWLPFLILASIFTVLIVSTHLSY